MSIYVITDSVYAFIILTAKDLLQLHSPLPLLVIPGSFDAHIQDLNRVLRQPIFEPLSDARIAGRQMNPRLRCFFANSTLTRLAIADIPFGPLKIGS
jgi:hypothetical protein